jgi:phage shock protein PspC (stress-responsive transcriptional regulator)
MKKTLQIHIGGRHFQIDEDAYQKLNHYLEALKSHFAADGDTGKEIVEDIEQRVAELLENKITNGKQAITLDDVNETIGILGKVEDFVYPDEKGSTHQEYEYHSRKDNRRLYRDPDNYYLGGVASGLGKYFDIDPLWIRLVFICLVFFNLAIVPFSFKGVGVLIYVILWIVVPKAHTTAEKLQMRGKPVNLSTIKDSVSTEYEKVRSGVSGLSQSPAADRTRNALENLMRAVGLIFVAIFKFIIGAIGIFFLVVGSIFLAGLIMLLLGVSNVFGPVQVWNGFNLPDFASSFASSGHYYLVIISLIILVLIPIAALIYGGIKILFNIKSNHRVLRAFLLTAWILALILFITLIFVNSTNNGVESSGSQSTVIEISKYPRMHIDMRDNTENKKLTHYWVFGYQFNYSEWDEALYDNAELSIVPSEDQNMHLTVSKRIKNVGMKNSQRYLNRINYYWEQHDSMLYLDQYFNTDNDNFWMFSQVDIKLRVPEGQVIVISQNACNILEENQRNAYCYDNSLVDKSVIISSDGQFLLEKQKTPRINNK